MRRMIAGIVLMPFTLGMAAELADLPTTKGYQLPAKEIEEVLDADPLAHVAASPDGKWLLVQHQRGMPSIDELSQSVLVLARHRIDPRTNASYSGVVRRTISGFDLVRAADYKKWRLDAPGGELSRPLWAPDGRHFVFLRTVGNGIELWVTEVQTRRSRALTGPEINTARNWNAIPCRWMPDSRRIICHVVPSGRGAAPVRPLEPQSPVIQEAANAEAPVQAQGGLLRDSHDEALYDYYMMSQPVLLDIETGDRSLVGEEGVYETALMPSPSGKYLLSIRIAKPYSFLLTDNYFPKQVDILDAKGRRVRALASLPMSESGSAKAGWTAKGLRRFAWMPGTAATLTYVEALDDGNPRESVAQRDRLMTLEPPFSGLGVELIRTRGRMTTFAPYSVVWSSGHANIAWNQSGQALVEEYDATTWQKSTWLVDARTPNKSPVLLWKSATDADVGRPFFTVDAAGQDVLFQAGNWIYLTGVDGDSRTLNRFNLKTRRFEVVFKSDNESYEAVMAIMGSGARTLLTRHETPSQPPIYYLRDLDRHSRQPITQTTLPVSRLARIKSERIHYLRNDGLSLSGDLYYPLDYVPGHVSPVIIWAYPLEYASRESADLRAGPPKQFPWQSGRTTLQLVVRLLATRGYAVLMDAGMPIIGGRTASDTAIQQLNANANAAIDKLVSMGIAQRDQIGIAGHSHGAWMVANLLAHSDRFAAGVAFSGVYNLTSTPFGFQNEGRTFWEVPETYLRLSPLIHADDIHAPLLLVHGDLDDNPSTAPIQSLQMYRALKGLGRTTRLVTLPYEGHAYTARESVMHVAWETSNWFDRHLKRKAFTQSQ